MSLHIIVGPDWRRDRRSFGFPCWYTSQLLLSSKFGYSLRSRRLPILLQETAKIRSLGSPSTRPMEFDSKSPKKIILRLVMSMETSRHPCFTSVQPVKSQIFQPTNPSRVQHELKLLTCLKLALPLKPQVPPRFPVTRARC